MDRVSTLRWPLGRDLLGVTGFLVHVIDAVYRRRNTLFATESGQCVGLWDEVCKEWRTSAHSRIHVTHAPSHNTAHVPPQRLDEHTHTHTHAYTHTYTYTLTHTLTHTYTQAHASTHASIHARTRAKHAQVIWCTLLICYNNWLTCYKLHLTCCKKQLKIILQETVEMLQKTVDMLLKIVDMLQEMVDILQLAEKQLTCCNK